MYVYVICEKDPTPEELKDWDWPMISVHSTLDKAMAAIVRSISEERNPKPLVWDEQKSMDLRGVIYWTAKVKAFDGTSDEVLIVQYPIDAHPEDILET